MSERKGHEERLEVKIKELEMNIKLLQAKLETIEEAGYKAIIKSRLEELRSRKYALEEKLEELKTSPDSVWEELRSGVESAFDEMKSAVENVIAKFGS